MAKKKRYRGQYCKVCGEVKSNEKFSGKGHRNHICKKCSKKSVAQREEEITLKRIYEFAMYPKISKKSRKVLRNYLQDESEKIRLASEEVMNLFTDSGRNNNFKEEEIFFFDEDNEEFYEDFDEEYYPDDIPF